MTGNPEAPVLQRIYDTFYTYDKYPLTDHSSLSAVLISNTEDGYRVITNPQGPGSAFDGLALEVSAPDGLFGESPPTAVKSSRDEGGSRVKQTS